MATTHTEIKPDRAAADTGPLAVTVRQACELTGLGPTSIWAFIKDGRLEAVRIPGVRRTLVSYPSLTRLLAPPAPQPKPRRQGRPRKGGEDPVTP
jgi:excisionase family DNA binding protein